MKWFLFLNYTVYKYYERKGDKMPLLFSCLGSVLLMYGNIFTILGILGFFLPVFDYFQKHHVVILMLVILLFNYLLIYHNGNYKEKFEEFDRDEELSIRWKNSVTIYIVSTIIAALIMLSIADYLN